MPTRPPLERERDIRLLVAATFRKVGIKEPAPLHRSFRLRLHVEVELVKEAMGDGRKEHAAHHQECHAAEQRVEGRKPFPRIVV